jgi:hypothetical protein
MAEATCLIAGAGNATPDGDVRFPSEFFVAAGAFAPGQVLNFGSLAYITGYYDDLHPLDGAAPTGTESPVPPLPLSLLGANLDILAQ